MSKEIFCKICDRNLANSLYSIGNPKINIKICSKCLNRINSHIELSLINNFNDLYWIFHRSYHLYYIKESLYRKIISKDLDIKKRIAEILKIPLEDLCKIKDRHIEYFSMQKIFSLLKKENSIHISSNFSKKKSSQNEIDKLKKMLQCSRHRESVAKSAIEKRKFGNIKNSQGIIEYRDLDHYLKIIKKEKEEIKKIEKELLNLERVKEIEKQK